MSLLGEIHRRWVFEPRVRVLSETLAELAPPNARVLDVGCGDGLLTRRIGELRPDLELSGIDVLVRDDTLVPVAPFDGREIPYEAGAFDLALFVDVLHHADDQPALLREAIRVSGGRLLIKDHLLEGLLAGPTLRLMDWFGNAHHGVALPYDYWRHDRWLRVFDELGLEIEEWKSSIGLYPGPFDWIFGRSLHFIARLGPRSEAQATG